ncbi:MAG: hypothetical protein P8Y54_04055 [Xanthomonadales bacterium]
MLRNILFACLMVLPAAPLRALDGQAERFVHLALELGLHDTDYVDAYLGPPEWRDAARAANRAPAAVAADIARLLAELGAYEPTQAERARHGALLKNVRAMDARARMALGESFDFATEARLIYDVDVPEYDFAAFDRALADVAALFPGEGDLAERVSAFRESLALDDARREAVVDRAIAECRERTLRHISLPADEGFVLEYVTGQSWGGYNWYQGDNTSLMQINLDLPLRASRVTSLGCHEGYPGHHVWNVLVENRLLKENGWVEFSVFPLFSPFALIGEGSANYGVTLAFPGDEKQAFERDVLFPLAGIDPARAETLARLERLTEALAHAEVATARLYLDGRIGREEAIEQRRKYGLGTREQAEKNVRFIEQYRSYVLNYSLGKDLVQGYVEAQARNGVNRWQAFEDMLTGLVTASQMAGH